MTVPKPLNCAVAAIALALLLEQEPLRAILQMRFTTRPPSTNWSDAGPACCWYRIATEQLSFPPCQNGSNLAIGLCQPAPLSSVCNRPPIFVILAIAYLIGFFGTACYLMLR